VETIQTIEKVASSMALREVQEDSGCSRTPKASVSAHARRTAEDEAVGTLESRPGRWTVRADGLEETVRV